MPLLSTGRRSGSVELHDVFVNHEGVIFRSGRIHPRSFAWEGNAEHYRRPTRYGAFLVKNALRRTVHVDEAAWIVDDWSGNYFHWVTESLARLVSIENLPSTLLIPRHYRHHPYVEFTLRGFPEIQRVGWVGLKVRARVGRLHCPPRLDGWPAPKLREVSRRIASLTGNEGLKRLYIMRENASRRRLTNHREVGQLLRKYHFEALHIDPARPQEQISALKSAECLVAVHGAALTNLMFMPPGANVIELRSSGNFDCFRPIAKAFGLRYHAQSCVHSPAPQDATNYADLTVDLHALEQTVTEAVERSG
jgi:capsular polysaccharide biosynthesis protein